MVKYLLVSAALASISAAFLYYCLSVSEKLRPDRKNQKKPEVKGKERQIGDDTSNVTESERTAAVLVQRWWRKLLGSSEALTKSKSNMAATVSVTTSTHLVNIQQGARVDNSTMTVTGEVTLPLDSNLPCLHASMHKDTQTSLNAVEEPQTLYGYEGLQRQTCQLSYKQLQEEEQPQNRSKQLNTGVCIRKSLLHRGAVQLIQEWWRAVPQSLKEMTRVELRERYLTMKALMEFDRTYYKKIQNAVAVIQKIWRSYINAKQACQGVMSSALVVDLASTANDSSEVLRQLGKCLTVTWTKSYYEAIIDSHQTKTAAASPEIIINMSSNDNSKPSAALECNVIAESTAASNPTTNHTNITDCRVGKSEYDVVTDKSGKRNMKLKSETEEDVFNTEQQAAGINFYMMAEAILVINRILFKNRGVQLHISKLQEANLIRRLTEAAVVIQGAFRTHSARLDFLVTKAAAEKLQHWWRECMKKRFLQDACNHIGNVITIQRWYRSRKVRQSLLVQVMSVRRIQSRVRVWLAKRHALIRYDAIIRLQAAWRGRMERVSGEDDSQSARLSEIRHRLTISSKETGNSTFDTTAKSMTLKQRTDIGMNFVIKYNMIAKILTGVKHLVVATHWSRECRLILLHSEAMPKLMLTVRSCNRSEPHKDIIQLTMDIIAHMAVEEDSAVVLFHQPGLVDTVLELLPTYVESGPNVFMSACDAILALVKHEVLRKSRWLDEVINANKLANRKHYLAVKAKSRKEQSMLSAKRAANNLHEYLIPSPDQRHSLQLYYAS